MTETLDLSHLDDRSILLVLNYLTEDIRANLSEEESNSLVGLDDAKNLVSTMLIKAGEISEPLEMKESLTDHEVAVAGRQLLVALAEDETLQPRIQELIDNPPQDDQMSVEMAVAGAILLGTVVSWLQTKAKIRYSRKNGKTEFEFDLEKRPANSSLLNNVAKSVAKLFTGLG